jgi:OPT family oligopeptide transporter
LAVAIALVFFIPLGIIQAISNFQVGLNVVTELVAGYVFPGRPIANMTFKVFGYMTMSKGLSFAGDLKLGHYMHVPPIMLFSVQVVATLWGGLVNVGVLYWALDNIDGICTSHAVQNFGCPKTTAFFTNSVVWGAVGPQRMFEPGQIYDTMLFFFLIGAVAPIPFYILARRYPNGRWKYINTTLFFFSTASIPPATAIKYYLYPAWANLVMQLGLL